MRIVCPNLDDFIANLSAAKLLFQNTIWCSTIRRPEGEFKNKHEAVKFSVILQASAVVVYDEDGSEALVEVGINCGTDYEDSSKDDTGTQEALRLRGVLNSYAEDRSLKVLPGLLDM